MKTYLFDSTFEGLLTTIYYVCKNKGNINIQPKSKFQMTVFDDVMDISTQEDIYKKVEQEIIRRCNKETLITMYKAFLSENPNIYNDLLKFFLSAMKYREEVLYMHANPKTAPVLEAQRKVSRESHAMLGLLRFKKVKDNLLYARYTPTNNITSLIAPHFSDRMNSINWIIHDEKRDVYAFYNTKNCIIGNFVDEPAILYKDIDSQYESMWRAYFKHISIPERKNKKLQISHMPSKYWHFLTENP